MIKTIKIESFKAHKSLEIVNITKNILLYGENGAGKSSIYEALKLYFFKKRLLEEQNLPSDFAQKKSKIKEFFIDFNNTQDNKDFKITINDREMVLDNDSSPLDFKLFMLSQSSTIIDNIVNINNILEKEFFNLNKEDISYEKIEKLVNKKLKYFIEDIEIKIEINGDLKIIDEKKGLEDKRLKIFFNEGKINLVLLLICLTIIRLYSKKDDNNILVLDDFITSLDMANRTFLAKCILKDFSNFQIFIFTHNIYFFNLIQYMINDIKYSDATEWSIYNLYETTNDTKIYESKDRLRIGKEDEKGTIKFRFKNLKDKGESAEDSFEKLGNDLRKKFERLLYEFSKLVSMGAVEESKKILENIEKKDFVVLDCYKVLKLLDRGNMKEGEFKSHKIEKFDLIKDILKDLKLYRKVMMHPLSHSTAYGEPHYNEKEIEKTIKLLEILEKNIKDLIDKKV